MNQPVGVRLIITYKIVKAILQVLAAVLLLYGAAHGLSERLADFAEKLREHAVHAWSNVFAAALLRFTRSRHSLILTAYALFADAALSSVEAWALSRSYTWGEWLVVGTTACLDPVRDSRPLDQCASAGSSSSSSTSAIVMYLVVNIRRRRRAHLP